MWKINHTQKKWCCFRWWTILVRELGLWPGMGGGGCLSLLCTVPYIGFWYCVLSYQSLFCGHCSHNNCHCHGFMDISKMYLIKLLPSQSVTLSWELSTGLSVLFYSCICLREAKQLWPKYWQWKPGDEKWCLSYSLSSPSAIRRSTIRTRPSSSKVDSGAQAQLCRSAPWPAPAYSSPSCTHSCPFASSPCVLSALQKVPDLKFQDLHIGYWVRVHLFVFFPFMTFALKGSLFTPL